MQTLDRGLQVLKSFTDRRPAWSPTQLAAALNLSPPIIYRILATLEDYRFVVRDGGEYRLGPQITELAAYSIRGMPLQRLARREMNELARSLQEAIYLTIINGASSVCIEAIDSPQPIRLIMNIGGRYPLYAGASNKVLLAYADDDLREEILDDELKSYTDRTVTDRDELRTQLAQIRSQGWAITSGELTPHATSVSVPISDHAGGILAALSIAGPDFRVPSNVADDYRKRLAAAAARIEAKLPRMT